MIRKIHIRSSVFIWYSDNNVLFYDTETCSHLLLPITNEFKRICATLMQPESMYSFSFDDNNPSVLQLVEIIKSKGFCVEEIEDESYISLPPILGINNNWNILKKEGKHQATIELLRTLCFILGKNDLCEPFFETSFCNMLKKDELLNLQELNCFFKNNHLDYLKNLYFFVSDACTIDYLLELESVIKKHQLESITKMFFVVDNNKLDILKRCGIDSLRQVAIYVNVPNQITTGFGEYVFIVHSYEELNKTESIINNYNLQCYKIYPQYNGSNGQFVEDVLFANIDEILNGKISKRHIYIHQALNIYYFGQLFVSPRNEVYSDPFKPPLGRLSEGIYSLVYKEMDNNYLWRKTRSDYEQCRNCLYRDLCPSPILEEEIIERKCQYCVI